jgi:ABC-2 type transport system ATP-binding protein
VGLAAALLHDPEVLILDEPTTGLDPNQIIEIREVIRNLGKNKTVLFSSHILQEVEALCDRVIIINKGKIVADDKIESLQKARMDSHFVQVQFKEPIDKNLLNAIREIIRTDELATNNFRLHTPNPESVRKELMELSLRHNLNIVSLQTGEQSLEEIFRGLTSTDQPNN